VRGTRPDGAADSRALRLLGRAGSADQARASPGAGRVPPTVIVCGLLTAAWNLWLFQDLRGYCAIPPSRDPVEGLAGILFSPSRGLLVYCPFLLFAVAGVACWRKRNDGALSLLFSASAVFALLISLWSAWSIPGGADTVGDRATLPR